MKARKILEQLQKGNISLEEAEQYFRRQPFDELGYAKLDTHREVRMGFPEVIYCSGKPDDYLCSIYQRMMQEQGEVFGTRAEHHQYEIVKEVIPEIQYDPISHILKYEKPGKTRTGCVAVCTAGTADIPVAEEAAQTAEYFGSRVIRIYDVGVSGIHRLFSRLEEIQQANCVVAVAGMEGALASVIGGLVSNPVIAVPTSVGYGASMHGLSALLTMINSCANGIAVVNIDNGYGAGYLATQVNRLAVKPSHKEEIRTDEMQQEKVNRLHAIMDRLTNQDIAVAFSGGVDSSVVLKLAVIHGAAKQKKVYALMADTELQPLSEISQAEAVAKELGADFEVVQVRELSQADIRSNPENRCYLCKKTIFQILQEKAKEKGAALLLEGTNMEDTKTYRPGLKAISELGICSPLLEAGFTKQEVRALAQRYGVPTAQKPATPCMATRFPYGTLLTKEALDRVKRGEEYLQSFSFQNLRLRIHGEVARIEVNQKEIDILLNHKEEIVNYLKQLGYRYVTIDMQGFRSGSMDEGLVQQGK